MASKKSKGAGGSKKSPVDAKEKAPVKVEEPEEPSSDHEELAEKPALAKAHAHDEHAHDAHAHAAHGHKPNIREYMIIFGVLAFLTVVEVAVAQIPGLSKTLLAIALIGLAVSKAAIVGLYYMHLKHETKILKYSVAIPVGAPAFYALVLIAEGAWRLAR